MFSYVIHSGIIIKKKKKKVERKIMRPTKRQRVAPAAPEPGGALLRWLRARGAEGLEQLEFRASSAGGGSGLGVFSRGGVAPGGRIARIPQAWYDNIIFFSSQSRLSLSLCLSLSLSLPLFLPFTCSCPSFFFFFLFSSFCLCVSFFLSVFLSFFF
jgi:hypothetical protein